MFARVTIVFTFLFSTLPFFTAAIDSIPQCNTGPVQCCYTIQRADSPPASTILGLLGIVVNDPNVLVGLNCSPITVSGGGNGGCNANPVCCENGSHGGLVSIDCTPVILTA